MIFFLNIINIPFLLSTHNATKYLLGMWKSPCGSIYHFYKLMTYKIKKNPIVKIPLRVNIPFLPQKEYYYDKEFRNVKIPLRVNIPFLQFESSKYKKKKDMRKNPLAGQYTISTLGVYWHSTNGLNTSF